MEQLTFHFLDDLTSSQEEPRAKTSRSRANARVQRKGAEPVPRSAGTTCAWLPSYALELSSGKMSSGVFPQTEDETSPDSWPKLQGSGMAVRGEFWTANTPEWTAGQWPSRSADAVCGLSGLLMETSKVPAKYFLSQRACLGILRRAEQRGKELPTRLRQALEAHNQQSSQERND